MPLRSQKFVFILALAAIALLAFVSTAELLPHHHDNINESVCPICHPPLMGLQPAALNLPSLTTRSWAVHIPAYRSVVTSPLYQASPRGPPAA
jgi:hypothetical protein